MKILEQIQANSITVLRFTCNDDDVIDSIHKIMDAIKKNSSILTVEFLDDFLGCLRSDARSQLLHSLICVPCLQEIRLDDGLIVVSDIADLLRDVKGLKVLVLKNIILQGIEKDFAATEMALHQHCSLKELRVENCRPAVEGISIDALSLQQPSKCQSSGTSTIGAWDPTLASAGSA